MDRQTLLICVALAAVGCGEVVGQPIGAGPGGVSDGGAGGAISTGGTTTAGGGGAAEGGGGMPPLDGDVLAVVDSDGVELWHGIDQQTSAMHSDATLAVTNARAVSFHLDRLVVMRAGDPPILFFDDIGALTTASQPDASIPLAQFGGGGISNVYDRFVDAAGHLWVTSDDGTRLFLNTSALDGTSTPAAHFQAPGDLRFARSDGVHLYAATPSSIVVWRDVLTLSGDQPTPTFELAQENAQALLISGGSLYVSVGGDVLVWEDVATSTMATAPTATLAMLLPDVDAMAIASGTLAVAAQNEPSVLLYDLAGNPLGSVDTGIAEGFRQIHVGAGDTLYLRTHGPNRVLACLAGMLPCRELDQSHGVGSGDRDMVIVE